jgi:hypothetical protein
LDGVTDAGSLRCVGIDPLFPQSSTFPLSEHGDYRFPLVHEPGPLRPFAATLAVPPPPESKKHDTTSTRPATSDRTSYNDDGKARTDTQSDTGSDS